jgi:hypothetical protein
MRRTILVVEDDHALRDVLMRGPRDEDFYAVPAPDGATTPRPATRLHLRPDTAGGRPRAALSRHGMMSCCKSLREVAR